MCINQLRKIGTTEVNRGEISVSPGCGESVDSQT